VGQVWASTPQEYAANHKPDCPTQRQPITISSAFKAGGKMIYTGPFFYEEHEEPYDFYRYTQFGLRHLFKSTGFVIERLDWLEGYFGTVGYQLNCMARYLPANPSHFKKSLVGYLLAPLMALLKIEFAACSIVFHKLETRFKFQARGYPKNYLVVASKPQ
jgi:hypothetical protein